MNKIAGYVRPFPLILESSLENMYRKTPRNPIKTQRGREGGTEEQAEGETWGQRGGRPGIGRRGN